MNVESISQTVESQLAEARQETVLDIVRRNRKSLSLDQLFELSRQDDGTFLQEMSIGELSGDLLDLRTKEGKAAAESLGSAATSTKSTKSVKKSSVDTRSVEGRNTFRTMVYQVLKNAKEPQSIHDVMEKTGGTILQVRTALNWHREKGDVQAEGNTRNMVYSPAK